MSLPITKVEDGLRFPATIQPRASRNEIAEIHNNRLKLKLTSPPVDGAANKLCLKILAKAFGLPASRISIVTGLTSRQKVIQFEGMDETEFRKKLDSLLSD